MLRILPLVVVIALGACASHQGDTTPLVQVPAEQRDDYWKPESETIATPLAAATSVRRMSQRVEVHYTIDTKGRVRDAEISSFSPQNSDPAWALRAVKAYRFKPGPGNPAGQPIRTFAEVKLEAPPAR